MSLPGRLLNLPLEVRNNIYPRVLYLGQPLFLFQETNSPLEAFASRGKPSRWLSLLYTCRQAHQEAENFVYSTNLFIFVDITPRQIDVMRSFFQTIGAAHSNQLHHLNINFPFTTGEARHVKLKSDDDDDDELSLIQQSCTNLRNLEMMVHSDNFQGMADVQDEMGEAAATAVLEKISDRLRSIQSLTSVTVVFHSQRNARVERLMRDLGWEVSQGKRYPR